MDPRDEQRLTRLEAENASLSAQLADLWGVLGSSAHAVNCPQAAHSEMQCRCYRRLLPDLAR